MAIEPVNASFYADPTSLNGLKRDAATQSPEALREAARQFESLFTSMMLKSMRSASGQDPLFGSDQADMYQDMFDQQMAVQMSRGKGMGLSDMLVRQLMGGTIAPAEKKEVSGIAASPAGIALDTTAVSGSTWPPRTHEDFVTALRPAATAAARELGVDADTIIAHAALETGWGKSMPAAADGSPSFNLFGVKTGGHWQGAAVTTGTNEFTGGRMQQVSADFRAYDSPEHAVDDYVRLLKSPRYANALGTGSDAAAFARGLQHGGYATDPGYVAKLAAVAARLKGGNSLPLTNTNAA